MKAAIAGIAKRAAAAAATLTGKRFGLLVASSLVATTGIVAAALTGTGESGALAALLGRSLASDSTPVATAPAPGRSSPGAGSSAPAQGGAEAAGGPLASPAPIAAPASVPAAKEPAPEQAANTPEAGRIKHVFVISLTSPGYEQSFGSQSQMPYLSGTLRPQGQLLSEYALLDDSGLANQIAAISGQPPNPATAADCITYEEFPATAKLDGRGVVGGSGCAYPVEALTVADQLTSGQFSWHAYVEGMVDETGGPHNCVYPGPGEADAGEPGGYVASQNPFVYFHSLLDVGGCAINDVPLEELSGDLAKLEKTPNYSYIAPTQCTAGMVGKCPAGAAEGAASADAFLAEWAPKILASPAYEKDGLLIVNFAAANPLSADAPPGTDPLRVGALLLSRFVAPGATDAGAYNPYSLLRSTEELFGLEPLGLAATSKVKSFAAPLLGEKTRGD
ncbi:MAG TPA: alkaline phosphatase family protein [Solirubrobacterales bacterium]|jgi:hypothetical protein